MYVTYIYIYYVYVYIYNISTSLSTTSSQRLCILCRSIHRIGLACGASRRISKGQRKPLSLWVFPNFTWLEVHEIDSEHSVCFFCEIFWRIRDSGKGPWYCWSFRNPAPLKKVVHPIIYSCRFFLHPNGGCFGISEPSTVFQQKEVESPHLPESLAGRLRIGSGIPTVLVRLPLRFGTMAQALLDQRALSLRVRRWKVWKRRELLKHEVRVIIVLLELDIIVT